MVSFHAQQEAITCFWFGRSPCCAHFLSYKSQPNKKIEGQTNRLFFFSISFLLFENEEIDISRSSAIRDYSKRPGRSILATEESIWIMAFGRALVGKLGARVFRRKLQF